ncbi:MAG: hypothetical protein AAB383_06440 [Patescibacteria group bacterium]
MNLAKKILFTGLAAFYCFAPNAFAATTILPETSDEWFNCDPNDQSNWAFWEGIFQDEDKLKEMIDVGEKADIEAILGCALKTGEIQFWMVPYYVIFAIEFVIDLAGLILVLMIMVGAYYYIAGGLTDDKEKGRTIITHAIGGFVLVLSSWIIVNIILLALTS